MPTPTDVLADQIGKLTTTVEKLDVTVTQFRVEVSGKLAAIENSLTVAKFAARTLIPLAIAMIGSLLWGAYWVGSNMSNINTKTQNNSERTEDLESTIISLKQGMDYHKEHIKKSELK